jgi:hypothetical protein
LNAIQLLPDLGRRGLRADLESAFRRVIPELTDGGVSRFGRVGEVLKQAKKIGLLCLTKVRSALAGEGQVRGGRVKRADGNAEWCLVVQRGVCVVECVAHDDSSSAGDNGRA